MAQYSVVITDHNFEDITLEERLLGDIASVEVLDSGLAPDNGPVANADAVLVRMAELDADVIRTMDDCKVISRYGVGVDHIDVDTATANDIWVGNAATYCVDEVAEHTVSLVLSLNRRITAFDTLMANGGWKTSPPRFETGDGGEKRLPIATLSSGTVGIVGYGTIGRRVGEYLSVFSDDVLVYDPHTDSDEIESEDVDLVGFDDLLAGADYITIHAPLTDRTAGMFDAQAFERMNGSAYVVNVARGGILDEDDLLDALDAGEIEGAAVDVFEDEPPARDDPLLDHEKVVTTPHVAYYSEASEEERRIQAVKNVKRVLTGDEPLHPVNTISDE